MYFRDLFNMRVINLPFFIVHYTKHIYVIFQSVLKTILILKEKGKVALESKSRKDCSWRDSYTLTVFTNFSNTSDNYSYVFSRFYCLKHFYILSETRMLRNDYFMGFFSDSSLQFCLKSILLNQSMTNGF